MLAFKRSSLAASEEQDNVLSRSSRVPHPKVNWLPSPPVYFVVTGCARTHPHRSTNRGKAEWGKSRLPRGRTCGPSGCESTESLPRQTSRRTDVFLVYPELSRDLSCRSVFSSSHFSPLPVVRAPLKVRVWYIAPKRTVCVASRGGVIVDRGTIKLISCRSNLRDTSRDCSREILLWSAKS